MLGPLAEEIVCLLDVAIWVGLDEVAVAAAGLKGALGGAAVGEREDAVAVHLVAVELALVALAGLPGHHTFAFHAVVLPIAFVCAGLVPVILAEAVDLVALELAVIGAAI